MRGEATDRYRLARSAWVPATVHDDAPAQLLLPATVLGKSLTRMTGHARAGLRGAAKNRALADTTVTVGRAAGGAHVVAVPGLRARVWPIEAYYPSTATLWGPTRDPRARAVVRADRAQLVDALALVHQRVKELVDADRYSGPVDFGSRSVVDLRVMPGGDLAVDLPTHGHVPTLPGGVTVPGTAENVTFPRIGRKLGGVRVRVNVDYLAPAVAAAEGDLVYLGIGRFEHASTAAVTVTVDHPTRADAEGTGAIVMPLRMNGEDTPLYVPQWVPAPRVVWDWQQADRRAAEHRVADRASVLRALGLRFACTSYVPSTTRIQRRLRAVPAPAVA